MNKKNQKRIKQEGIATSDSVNKTVKVEILRTKIHPLYHERFNRRREFLVHTDKTVKKGDNVEIVSVRPISKKKSWKVV